MARIKNTGGFQGATIYEADVRAPTWKRVLRNVAGDLAFLFDAITGQNGETDTIDHSGAPRGSPLGQQWVNQWIGHKVVPLAASTVNVKNGGMGPTYLIAMPIYIPAGETNATVVLGIDKLGNFVDWEPWEAIITDESGTVLTWTNADGVTFEQRKEMQLRVIDTHSGGVEHHAFVVTFNNLTPGRRLLFVQANTVNTVDGRGAWFSHLTVGPMQGPTASNTLRRGFVDRITVLTPGATEGLVFTETDEAEMDTNDGESVSGVLLTRFLHNVHGLWEYITGWPAGNDPTTTLVDHDSGGAADDTNPARARSFAHTRSLYASEPLVRWPLWGAAFGAWRTDGYVAIDAVTPTEGLADWFGLIPRSVSLTTVCGTRISVPDFAGTYTLRVLCGSRSGTPTNWTVSCAIAGASGSAAVSSLGFSGLYMATITGLALGQDTASGSLEIRTQRSGSLGAFDELVVLGACLALEV
jgi:hypothetical protein